MARVSVIIPTYNRERFIGEAIHSVLSQTYPDFEIIVVDDGSTDTTQEVVAGFGDPRIRYIYQDNQWVVAARNRGINASSGEYLTFLDSDDALTEDALEKGVQILDKYPEVSFCYTQNYSIDESGRVIGLQKKRQEYSWVRAGTEQIREFLVNGHHVGVCGTMIRRSCLLKVGLWDASFQHGSVDFDLLVRLAKKHNVAYIDEPGGSVRVHQNSITGVRDLPELEKTNGRVFESVFQDPEIGHLFTELRSTAYFRLYLRLASVASARKDRKTCNRYFIKALRVNKKEFLKGLWLPWLRNYASTLAPSFVKRMFHRFKRILRDKSGSA